MRGGHLYAVTSPKLQGTCFMGMMGGNDIQVIFSAKFDILLSHICQNFFINMLFILIGKTEYRMIDLNAILSLVYPQGLISFKLLYVASNGS